jgi:uncharacterized RDD family membrane protein YckC
MNPIVSAPTAFQPASTTPRVLAAIIDVFIGALAGFVAGFFTAGIGGLVGLIYAVVRDGLFDGRSVGKKLMGIRVVALDTGAPCTVPQSVIRHVVSIIPCVGQVYAIVEVVKFLSDAQKRRFGDYWAGTIVIDG